MKKRITVPVLAIVAVLALVLGSFGTATAAGLTAKQVKKIAKKVVKKQAPKLTVKNANNLGGQPASTYLTNTYVYTLPQQTADTTRSYSFPGLPAGKYVVTYQSLLGNNTATKHDCWFDVGGGVRVGWAYSTPGYVASFSGISGSAYLDFSGSAPPLFCESDGTWFIFGTNTVNNVTFTRADVVTTGTPVGVKATAVGTPGAPR